jgi:putative nucleotidyltransferase with HDIG domain
MTLIELRDPKQPLLRELQQRAPGTYNHSLNVASIAESAAESIGADSLLTYVGCLYHDIGKMNKPMYFVENQSGGPNKHDKLNPAMSLLVIVGHVKDGMEIARSHGLPRNLRHFIEGTPRHDAGGVLLPPGPGAGGEGRQVPRDRRRRGGEASGDRG